MIDFTDFQTAWNEYYPYHSLMDYVVSSIEVGFIFSMMVGFTAFAVYGAFRRPSLGSFCKKVVLPSVVSGLIATAIALGVMVCNVPPNAGNTTKPDSFGTVISERYRLDSLSCKTSADAVSKAFGDDTETDLDMDEDLPSDGEYACTGYDSKHIYKNLTLVVNNNKAGLYNKKGNALTLKETNNAD